MWRFWRWTSPISLLFLCACQAQEFSNSQSNNPFTTSGNNSNSENPGDKDIGDWTALTASVDTRIVYVSSSTGDDLNDGLTKESAKRTIANARLLIRSGYPDWLLLKRGDQWEEIFGHPDSGRSASEPFVLSSYGEGARPILHSLVDSIFAQIGERHFITVKGIHFSGVGRPASQQTSGVIWEGTGSHLLVEDCKFEFLTMGITIDSHGDTNNIKIRRNIFSNFYGTLVRPLAIYAVRTDSILIEDNFFNETGWENSQSPSPHTNGIAVFFYDANNFVIRKNIFSRHVGPAIRLQESGIVEDNLIFKSFGGITMAAASVTARANIILDATPYDPGFPFVFGIDVDRYAGGVAPLGPVRVDGNIIKGKNTSIQHSAAIRVLSNLSSSATTTTVTKNTVYDWQDTELFLQSSNWYDTVDVSENTFYEPGSNPNLYMIAMELSTVNQSLMHFSGNRYFSSNPASKWFLENYVDRSWAQWVADSGELNSSNQAIAFKNPGRDMNSYAQTVGLSDEGDLIEKLKTLEQGHWPVKFSAGSINSYIRDGFN